MEPARRSVIVVLPADVANQIAAGEVVERPASVLKELVENALDAGARTVSVTVDEGGIGHLAVTDDGSGMGPDDLTTCVLRHATSKIRTVNDLVGVGTYGFRGEALPSIASVSRLRIASRTADRDEGTELTAEAGMRPTVRPVGCAIGTTVAVSDLFFNTPARRKFLRATATEAAQCTEALVRLAMPRPDVRFVLRKDGKVVREFARVETAAERAREIYRDEKLTEVSGARGGVRVTAMLGAPERARAGAQALALYVNGRAVRDRVLLRAVAQAYGSVLSGGRYPVGALMVDVNPEDVDVNVHPQKTEVRFARQGEIFGAITAIVRDHVARTPWNLSPVSGPSDDVWAGRFEGGPVTPPTSSLFNRPSLEPSEPETGPDPWSFEVPSSGPSGPLPYREPPPATHVLRDTETARIGAYGSLRFVAQVRRMFLVCEGPLAMVVLDQHAAAERVTFHRLRAAYARRAVALQPLLVPEQLDVSAAEAALVETSADALNELGVDLGVVGPTTVVIRAVPALMGRANPKRLARDVLAELERASEDFSRARDLVLATMACHGSVRAGDDVTREEAEALLRALDEVDFAGHCPHGRPIVWSMPWGELERKVGR